MVIKRLLTNKFVLYFTVFLALMNVIGYIQKNDMKALTFFVVLGYLSSYFSKNMIINLAIAILGTNLEAFNVGKVLLNSPGIDFDLKGYIFQQLKNEGVDNVELIIGGHNTTNLPLGKIDMLFMVDVYHELEFPHEIMTDIYSKLQARGRLVLVEYRKEDKELMIKPLHKMSEQQIILEIESAGFSLEKNLDILPTQHMIFFKK